MMKIVIAFAVGENHTKPMVARGRARINRPITERMRKRIDEKRGIQDEKNPGCDRK
jgi:hypothetical protein